MTLNGPSLPSSHVTLMVYAIAEDVHRNKQTEAIYTEFQKMLSSKESFDFQRVAKNLETAKKNTTTRSVFIASKDRELLHDSQKHKKFIYQELTKKQFQQKFPKSQGALAVDISDFEKTTKTTQDIGTSILTQPTSQKARRISVLPLDWNTEISYSPSSAFISHESDLEIEQFLDLPSLTPSPMTQTATPSPTETQAQTPPPTQEVASARASGDQNPSVSSMILTNIRNLNRSVKALEDLKESKLQQLLSLGSSPQLIEDILAPIKNIKTLIGNRALGEDWSQPAGINKKMLAAIVKAHNILILMSPAVFSIDSRRQLEDDLIQLLGALSHFTPPKTHETSTDQKQLEGILAANRKLIDIYQQQFITTVNTQKIPDPVERRSKRVFFITILLPLYEKNCQLAELLLDLKGEDANLQELLYTSDRTYTLLSRRIKGDGPESRQAWL